MNADTALTGRTVRPRTATVGAIACVLVAVGGAGLATVVATRPGQDLSGEMGGTTDDGFRVARLGVVQSEGAAALRCAAELRTLARNRAASTARAVHVLPAPVLVCGSAPACLADAAIAAIDDRADTLSAELRRLDDRGPRLEEPALDLAIAHAHATANELCADRDLARSVATADGGAEQH